MKRLYYLISWVFLAILCVHGLQLPSDCEPNEYYDAGLLKCQYCSANASMVVSNDGFGCTCDDRSIPMGASKCKPCNATEVVSSDGNTCVPRRCQNTSGRFVCRKCPGDYISVTQNLDGSPLKEVQCVRCARGYKPVSNSCVKCEACTCNKTQIVVRGICIPKTYLNARPKYENSVIHPTILLDIVKYEYLCMQTDARACRKLANECVKHFYSSELAGPCRIWLQSSKSSSGTELPQLTLEPTTNDKSEGKITLPHGKYALVIAALAFTYSGGVKILNDPNQNPSPCHLPVKLEIGTDFTLDCNVNASELSSSEFNETFSPFVHTSGDWKPVPVTLRKPDGYFVETGRWTSRKFRRYFLIHNMLSITANTTNTIYLRTFLIRLSIARDSTNSGLTVRIATEAQYAIKSPLSDIVTMTLKIENQMPSTETLRGLEVWGGVLGTLLSLYAMVQWRSTLRRGGLHISAVPLLAGAVADTLYFSALFSTIHSLAAEAGVTGLTVPLSRGEEIILKAFAYSSVSLKILKVLWINWNQCRCDIFFLDWSEHNSKWKETSEIDNFKTWKMTMLAREWSKMQTKRRTCPGVVATLTVTILHILAPWLPESQGYAWATANAVWWSAYAVVLLTQCLLDRFLGSLSSNLPKICTGAELSVLVFEEEYYAHYIHGRNDSAKDIRSMAGPLAACRVVCAPQLRAIYKQLSTSTPETINGDGKKHALLSRFMAAFFERALDGLGWVASERTIIERLLDVELSTREAATTSTLLHDGDSTPSAFAMMWWGQEWNLATFDVMVFSCLLMATGDFLLAAFVTVVLWQILKLIRTWFGDRNIKAKTEIKIY